MHRHPTDLVSLFFGLLFIGLAVTGTFGGEDIVLLQAQWVWPVLLVVAGLAIVVLSMGRNEDSSAPRDASAESAARQRSYGSGTEIL